MTARLTATDSSMAGYPTKPASWGPLAVPVVPACAVPGSCFARREAGFAGTPVHPAKQASRGPPVVAVCPATLGLTGVPTRPASWGPLTSAPQAPLPLTASTSRFLAAFTSRSMTRPHPSQVKTRSARDSLAFTIPPAEQVLELGKNRSATMSRPPRQLVLPLSCRRTLPKVWSERLRANRFEAALGYHAHTRDTF